MNSRNMKGSYSFKKDEAPPPTHELHRGHLLWLLDAVGHASAIEDRSDATEKMFK